MKILKVGTDFSGIGSPEEALRELKEEGVLNYECEFSCEIDKFARLSHKELHKSKVFYEDITERNHSEVPKLDLYVAGFPCQAFSIAGKQKGFEDVRGTLFFNVADFIRENQPETFILENVKGLLSHDKGKTFQTIIDLLSNCGGTVNGQMALDFFDDGLGYHIHFKVLNTKEHGIPQNRERIFIVGFKESRDYGFPIKEPLELRLKDLLEDEVDEKYYLSDKMIESFTKHKERHDSKGNGFSFKPKTGDDIANCLRANAALCPTDNALIVLDKIIKEGFINQDTQASQVYRSEGISPSLSAGTHVYAQGYIIHKDNLVVTKRIRRLTPLECWRLQGFSDKSFYAAQAVNSDTQLYKQAGNSISVPVIKKVISNIYRNFNDK